jgi:long-chain fatty acid transport protein
MYYKNARAVTLGLAASAMVTMASSGRVLASGFMLPESSTAGMATTNAMVANPREIGAISYNAAAMGFHGTSSVALGAVAISPSFSVTTASGNHTSHGAEWVGLPLFQAAIKVTDRWRVGLGISVPFGLETRWDYGTFPILSKSATLALPAPIGPVTIPTGNHPTASKLEVVDFVPTVAFRVNDNLSLAAGVDVYWARTAQLNSNLGELSGDGTGVGFNLSAMYQINALTLGASFHSSSTIGLSGDYIPTNRTMVALGRLQPQQSANLDFNLPWRLQLGARYEFTKELAAEFDWSYTGWSRFQSLAVYGNQTGALIFSDSNNWSNASAYRLGLTWQVLPQTRLRFGYSYDQTGQGDGYFSARVPDTNRQLFGIGASQDLGNGFAVSAAYMYVMGSQRNFSSAVPYTSTSGVNGTEALNGKYEMSANLIGIEVSKTF